MKTPAQPTILFVDGDSDYRSVFAEVLAISGFRVLVAPEAEEAVQTLASRPVDVLITEIEMPSTSGAELAEKARSMKPSLRVLYTTASAEHAAEYERARRGSVLRKPFQPAEILAEVRSALEGWPWMSLEESCEPPAQPADQGSHAVSQGPLPTPMQEPAVGAAGPMRPSRPPEPSLGTIAPPGLAGADP